MNAVISGRAGVAILVEKDRFFSLDVNEPDRKVPRRPEEVRFLLGEGRDLRFFEDIAIEEVKRRLEEEASADEALHLALILLDGEHQADLREEAAAVLETLLKSEAVAGRLEGVLYARPMPASMDAEGALVVGRRLGAMAVVDLIEALVAFQAVIEDIWAAWDMIPIAVFGGADDRGRALAAMVREGLFPSLARIRAEHGSMDGVVAVALQSATVRAVRNHREVLSRWVAPLRPARIEREIETSDDVESEDAHAVERSAKKRRPAFNRAEVFQNVQRQKQSIVRAMDHNDLERARDFVKQLVAYQLRHGQASYASMSLCDLAASAQARGLYTLQLDFTWRSTRLSPSDAWSWNQHGKALLNTHDLAGALDAYERSLALRGDVVAKTGRAEVLKAQGKLDDALTAYDQVLREHPSDVVAKNGRAEVLKAQGKLDDALNAYDQVLREHPSYVVTKNGRAEVLKAQGKLDDALNAYDQLLHEHPSDVVVKNGRAGVLKAQGKLDGALTAYSQLLREHPSDVVGKNGRAEVLKAQGKLDDALVAYDQVLREHPADVFAKNGRAEVLKTQGKLDDAFAAYTQVLREHPSDVVAKSGRAEVLKAQGKFDDALAAYSQVLREHPADAVAKNARACILAALGRAREAFAQLPSGAPVTREDWVGYHIRGMILLRTGQTDAAIAIFEQGMKDNPWPAERDSFRSALAVARLRRREYEAAIAQLALVKLPLLQEPANTLRVHAFGMQGQADQAAEAYRLLAPVAPPHARELRAELRRRFIAHEPPQHDDDWLIEREIDYILAA